MWRDSIRYSPIVRSKILSCASCPFGLQKYVEFSNYSNVPVEFFVDRSDNPGEPGIIEAHYWTNIGNSPTPSTSNRVWLADIPPGGGRFFFQPTPEASFLSLYKRNPLNSNFFDAICFRYIPQSRLFVPQVFD